MGVKLTHIIGAFLPSILCPSSSLILSLFSICYSVPFSSLAIGLHFILANFAILRLRVPTGRVPSCYIFPSFVYKIVTIKCFPVTMERDDQFATSKEGKSVHIRGKRTHYFLKL